jgi:hypothetical protein
MPSCAGSTLLGFERVQGMSTQAYNVFARLEYGPALLRLSAPHAVVGRKVLGEIDRYVVCFPKKLITSTTLHSGRSN